MKTAANWFEVDRRGLGKLMEGRSKAFILYELLSNAWDQRVTEVDVTLTYEGGTAAITVRDDDPDGFADLKHAYTLFAESSKKGDPEQRGRFNLGEKLVLALATEATITTTKGGVRFDKNGRHVLRGKTRVGSVIRVLIPMSKADFKELSAAADKVIAPLKAPTTVNDVKLPHRGYRAAFEIALPTLIADRDGVMHKTTRKCWVEVHDVLPGEKASIYEMGIPVVETGDKYHINVGQKVPLNTDRDNVTPSYLRTLRVEVLNRVHENLEPGELVSTWVKEACCDEKVASEALTTVILGRFGDNAVVFDPSDPEANKIAVAEGRQVIHGGSLSAEEWANVRAHGVVLPAGQVTPSPKPFGPDGKPLVFIEHPTSGMQRVATFAIKAAYEILGINIAVRFAVEPQWPFRATYGDEELIFNVGKLGHPWFNAGITEEVIDLVIHELGHQLSGDHLSREYNDALTLIGAKMTRLALKKPELFK